MDFPYVKQVIAAGVWGFLCVHVCVGVGCSDGAQKVITQRTPTTWGKKKKKLNCVTTGIYNIYIHTYINICIYS